MAAPSSSAAPTTVARSIDGKSLERALLHAAPSVAVPALFSAAPLLAIRTPTAWRTDEAAAALSGEPRTSARVAWTDEKLLVWFRAGAPFRPATATATTMAAAATMTPVDRKKMILSDSRVEIFLGAVAAAATDGASTLERYRAYEMNRAGHVLDFSVVVPKQFDFDWHGGARLEAQWTEGEGESDEVVHMLVSVPWADCDATLPALLRECISSPSSPAPPEFHLGLYRGEVRSGGSEGFFWQSWRDVPSAAVDFHVPISFGRLRLEMPRASAQIEPAAHSHQPLCRRVTDATDVAHVQRYLRQHFPASIKLCSLIQSWQQQLEVRHPDDLVDPLHPRLWVSVPPSFPVASPVSSLPLGDFDVVLLSYGPGNTAQAIADAIAALPPIDADPKPHRPHAGIYVGHYARAASADKLYAAIVECLPTNICVQFAGCDATFNPLLERLAAEKGGQLVYNPHQQWMKLPPGAPNEVAFIEPSALTKEEMDQRSHHAMETAVASPAPAAVDGAGLPSSSPSIVVAPLRPEHASLVDRWWPYASAASPPIIAWLLAHLPTACVYVDGQPACWVLAQCYGGIGMLHTMEGHRGRGYARLAVNALCADLFRDGRSAFCYIGRRNVPSQKVFASLGFRPTHCMDWVTFIPNCYHPDLQSPNAH